MSVLPVVGLFTILMLIVPVASFAQENKIILSSYSTSINPHDSILILGETDQQTAKSFVPVKLTVTDPTGNLLYAPKLSPSDEGKFKYLIKPPYATLPQFVEGEYTVTASHPNNNSATMKFTVVKETTTVKQSTQQETFKCNQDELLASGQCIPYSISGGSVSSAEIKEADKSIAVTISADRAGTLVLNPSSNVIGGINMVLVDGKEWKQTEIDGNEVTVEFSPGTHVIETVGTFVIPEFGTIASVILVISIMSVIIITGRNRIAVPKI